MIKGFSQIKETMDKTKSLLKMKAGSKLMGPCTHFRSITDGTCRTDRWFLENIECLGKRDCPICKSGKSASFKTYLPVLDIAEDKVKIFKASMMS